MRLATAVAPEGAGSRGDDPVRLRIGRTPKDDIEDLLAWSEERFEVAARQRYERLLSRALLDIAEDLARPGVKARPELGTDVVQLSPVLQPRKSSERAGPATGRVLRPRHFNVRRLAEPGLVDILRVLHDSMEVSRHLPEESP